MLEIRKMNLETKFWSFKNESIVSTEDISILKHPLKTVINN